MLESLHFKRLKFMSALSFMISITTFCYWYYIPINEWDLFVRAGLLTDLYFVIGLASDKLNEMKLLFSHSYDIWKTPLNDAEKLNQIKSFVGRVTSQWVKYFRLWEEISQAKPHSRLGFFIDMPKRIVKGNITVGQFVWIILNFIYTVVATSDIIDVPAPLDFVIMLMIFGIVLFASGSVSGMGETMAVFMKALMPTSEKEIRAYLDTLEGILSDAMRDYYMIALRQERMDLPTNNNKK